MLNNILRYIIKINSFKIKYSPKLMLTNKYLTNRLFKIKMDTNKIQIKISKFILTKIFNKINSFLIKTHNNKIFITHKICNLMHNKIILYKQINK